MKRLIIALFVALIVTSCENNNSLTFTKTTGAQDNIRHTIERAHPITFSFENGKWGCAEINENTPNVDSIRHKNGVIIVYTPEAKFIYHN